MIILKNDWITGYFNLHNITMKNTKDNVYINRQERTRQSIVYGSVYESLIHDFITVSDILNYLLDNNMNPKTMIAYRAVCQFSRDQILQDHPNSEYNDKPFILLTDIPEYHGIFTLSVCINGNIPGNNEKERNDIAKKTQKIWPKLITINDFSRSLYLICDIFNVNIRVQPSESYLLVASRSVKLISSMFSKLTNLDLWLDNDYLIPLEDSYYEYEDYEDKLLARCETLKKDATLYWNGVGEEIYKTVVSKNLDPSKPHADRETMKRYVHLFPGVFSSEWEDMSNIVYNIKRLDKVTQAYILGYPIHMYIPDLDTLNKTIAMLDKIGPNRYCEMMSNKNKLVLSNHIQLVDPLSSMDDIHIANTQDALMEQISDYNLFDVIRYYVERKDAQNKFQRHVYYFTRPEFPGLAENKKNIWTNEKLPLSVISEINSRNETSLVYNLPKSATLIDLITQIEKGELHLPETFQILRNDNSIPRNFDNSQNNNVPIAQIPSIPDQPEPNEYQEYDNNVDPLIDEFIDVLAETMVNNNNINSLNNNLNNDITFNRQITPEQARRFINLLSNNGQQSNNNN
jgi:hypothetical protein